MAARHVPPTRSRSARAIPRTSSPTFRIPRFTDAAFGASGVAFAYTPPAGCGRSWSRVVLRTTVSVDAGEQYDRTGQISLDGVTLWFGTTSEPRASLAPRWTVEDDVTKDTTLFRKSGSGRVIIPNYQNSTDTSTIHATAALYFYPASRTAPAPDVPDLVIPIANDSDGGPASLSTGASTLAATLTLPANVARAELALTLQGQSDDEFWYTCVPTALAASLESCGSGAFREGEVTIDGTPAGEAPVYPLIFTGGIDPYLWEPIPGVTTLDVKPFGVNLTPFAATLSNGAPHTLSISVANADSYFSAFGTLYVTLDRTARTVTGGLLSDTLTGATTPTVATTSGITAAGATTHLATTANDAWRISGFANTSAGRITTTVAQTNRFSNVQDFLIGSAAYDQAIRQQTDVATVVTTTGGPRGTVVAAETQSYPLTVAYDDAIASDGAQTVTTTIGQTLLSLAGRLRDTVPVDATLRRWDVHPTDTLVFDASGDLVSHSAAASRSTFASVDLATGCDLASLASKANVLTAATRSADCAGALRAILSP